jgi:hypothetical protein
LDSENSKREGDVAEIRFEELGDATCRLEIVGTKEEILSLFELSEGDIDLDEILKCVEADAVCEATPLGSLGWDPVRDIDRIRKKITDKVIPMKNYCVTYRAGNREQRETIHVRGGRDLAKIRAYAAHGDANVISVERGACPK